MMEGLNDTFGHREGFQILERAVLDFLSYESTDNAFNVYSAFFEIYQVTDRGTRTAFLNLIDLTKLYEENAAKLTLSQRDHFIHSVNVFILGLSIYANNSNYRKSFSSSKPPGNVFKSDHERFLYCWGLSALIHDVGYPVEIASNQINRFLRYISAIDHNDPKIRGTITFNDFNELRYIDCDSWMEQKDIVIAQMGYDKGTDIFDSYQILSYHVSRMTGMERVQLLEIISGFVDKMEEEAFIDHAFYSTIIVLKWMGHIYQKCRLPPQPFYSCVSDVASAILLHNLYRRVLTKEPYSLPPLDLDRAPLAYMMILCDELQEWNRKSYGYTKPEALPENSTIYISESMMHVDYRTTTSRISGSFANDKVALLYRLLDIHSLYPEGIEILCTSEHSADLLIEDLKNSTDSLTPVLSLENIISLAKEIHREYNAECSRGFPGSNPEYPTWNSLPQDLKYSNITQARDIPIKLREIGCELAQYDDPRPAVEAFTEVEMLVMGVKEHERWVNERRSNGWVYGNVKDVKRRHSPYITTWENIPERIKEYDFEAVRKIPKLIKTIGMKVVRRE